jgi:hypothetical protein
MRRIGISMIGSGHEKYTPLNNSFTATEDKDMENFTFFNPTQIEFGTGKEKLIGQHLGWARVECCGRR